LLKVGVSFKSLASQLLLKGLKTMEITVGEIRTVWRMVHNLSAAALQP
jgi:hypothetical protein